MLLSRAFALLADEGVSVAPWHPSSFAESLLGTAVFGLLGLVLLFLGYKIFDWLTPHLHIEKELAEKNLAVAIVVAAILIALGIIVARTVGA
jgi:putative membrane protein